MSLDPKRNFVICTVSGTYSSSDTSITLTDASSLPIPSTDGSFNVVWFNSTDYPQIYNDPLKEIIRVTDLSSNTITIVRPATANNYNGEGSDNLASDKNLSGKIYKIALVDTRKNQEDINTSLNSKAPLVSPTFSTSILTDYLTTGSIPFIGASGLITQDNANLFWDNTSKRLGIGTTSPATKLDFGTSGALKITESNITEVYLENKGLRMKNIYTLSDGWARAFLTYQNSSGSNYFSLGALGNGQNLTYAYFGPTYDNTWQVWKNGNVGIGTTSPSQQLEITGNFRLPNTTSTGTYGVIYKGTAPFIHDFNYGNNGTVTTSGRNTFIGINAGNLTMGSTATSAGQSSYNTGIGYQTLFSNTTGYSNTALGYQSLYYNTTGYYNTAQGYASLYSNTTGYYNTALGVSSLFSNTTGYYNTAVGYQSLSSNTSGARNTAIGVTSLNSNTTGDNNIALGLSSLRYNTTGGSNTAIGVNALNSNTTGSNNVALGMSSGLYIADGSTANQTSSNSTYLGFNTKALADGDTNETVIGYDATGVGSNSVVLGNDSVTKTILKGNVGIGTTSPTGKLSIFASASTSVETNVISFNSGANELSSIRSYNAGSYYQDMRFYVSNGSSSPNLINALTIKGQTGRVGMGTSSPSAQLEVSTATANSQNLLKLLTSGVREWTQTDASDNAYKYMYNGSGTANVLIHTQGNSYFNGGNVGIGTTTPTQQLDMTGNINLVNTTNANKNGIIYKNGSRFISDFNYGNNGTVTTAGANTFVGINAGNFTMGSTATSASHSSYNTGIGNNALASNTTGYYNTALGFQSLYANTTGYQNTSVGVYSLPFNTTGYWNTANGYYSLYSNTTGNQNTAIGATSLANNTTGTYNTAIGVNSGRYIADGTTGNQASNNSTYLGFNTKALADGDTNETVIGYNATGAGSNSVVLGNDSVTKTILKGSVGIGTTSPTARLHLYQVSAGDLLKIESESQAAWINFLEAGTNRGYLGFGDSGSIFTGADTDSMALRATGSLHLGASSSIGLTIKSTTNYVGIGTTSPATKLDIVGTGGSPSGTPSFPVRITSGSGTNPGFIFERTDASQFVSLFTGSGGAALGFSSGLNRLAIGTYTYENRYSTSYPATEVMSLLSNGNVGIGTTSPTSVLDIISSTPSATATYNRGVLFEVYGAEQYGGKGVNILVAQGTKSAPTTVTTSAIAPLSQTAYFYDGTYWRAGSGINSYVDGVVAGTSVSSGIAFFTGNITGDASQGQVTGRTERMRITSDGKVGIGTTSPSVKLDVLGTIYSRVTANSTWGIAAINNDTGNIIGGFYRNSAGNGNMYLYLSDATPKVLLAAQGDSYFTGGKVSIGTGTAVNSLDIASGYIGLDYGYGIKIKDSGLVLNNN